MAMMDWYKLGSSFGETEERLKKAELDARTQTLNQQRTQGLIDDESYARQRTRREDSLYDADLAAADAPAAPQGGVPMQGGAAPAQGTGAPQNAARFKAMGNRAARMGNAKGLADAEGLAKQSQRDEVFKSAFLKAKENPEAVITQQNGAPGDPKKVPGNPSLAIGNRMGPDGKPTGYTVVTLDPSGRGYAKDYTPDELAAISGYTAAMQVDPEWAMAGIAQIDKNLATLFATKLKNQLDVQNSNTQSLNGQNQAKAASDRTAAQIEIATMRQEAARMRAEAAQQNKTIPPELLATHNGLIEQLGEATDPQVRKRLLTQVNAVNTQIANALGKPRALPAEKETNPNQRASIVKAYVEAGLKPTEAEMRADMDLGRANPVAELAARLKQMDDAKKPGAKPKGIPDPGAQPQGPVYGSAEDTKMRLGRLTSGAPAVSPGLLPTPMFGQR